MADETSDKCPMCGARVLTSINGVNGYVCGRTDGDAVQTSLCKMRELTQQLRELENEVARLQSYLLQIAAATVHTSGYASDELAAKAIREALCDFDKISDLVSDRFADHEREVARLKAAMAEAVAGERERCVKLIYARREMLHRVYHVEEYNELSWAAEDILSVPHTFGNHRKGGAS